MGFIDRPKQVWWRKAMFQVHLWVGVALCLYLVVMGVTGSILVFESELEHTAYSHLWRSSTVTSSPDRQTIGLPAVIETVRKAYASYQVTVAYMPDRPGDNFEVFVRQNNQNKLMRYVFVDAYTGQIVGDIDPDRSWLVWIINLHFRLLAGKTGHMLNGIGASCLLALCITGAVIWWAGLLHWARGLTVNFRGNWRKINYDLHSAVGLWSLAFVTMWSFTGIYFAWPKTIESAVNSISSTTSARPPQFSVPPRGNKSPVGLNAMIQQAERSAPDAKFAGAFFPLNDKAALTLLMAREEPRNFTQMDYVYFDPTTGRQLATWYRGINKTLGAKFISWLSPIHFGSSWGLAVKILWALLGCSLPLLSVTGIVMYWNRFLGKRLRMDRLKSF